ncbi:MAG TPA: GNAT family N-acetyltransferase [Solirubrobacteraceae bacterium]|nr:GNAT family N-acetyltransferase [Solirubrobacteraceae bacterium]
MDWPAAEPIQTARLTLEPLRVDHAGEMREVLGDPALYEYTGGKPPSLDELRTRFAMQAVGRSPDGRRGWLNWIARERDTGAAIGTVQATLDSDAEAEIAWIIGAPYQRRGFATEAAGAMVGWLQTQGVATITAHIHPDHLASMGVARRLGLTATDVVVGGETRWQGPLACPDS